MTMLRGAAVHKRIEKQLRAELAAYGLDMSRWALADIGAYRPGEPFPSFYASFTDGNGRTIQVDNISTDDAGGLDQYSSPVLC